MVEKESSYIGLEELQGKVLNDIYDYIVCLEISNHAKPLIKIRAIENNSMELTLGPYNFLIVLTSRLTTKLITVETFRIGVNPHAYPNKELTLMSGMTAICHLAGFFKMENERCPQSVILTQNRLQAGKLYFECLQMILRDSEKREFELLDTETQALFD